MTIRAFRYYFSSLCTLLKQLRNPGVLAALCFHDSSRYAVRVELKSGVTFFISSLMDLWILKETVMDRQYEEASLELQDGWNVVDIGAAFGDYSVWAAKQIPHGRLLAVEPYPPSVTLLRSNLESNGIHNAEVFAGAIASTEGSSELKIQAGRAVQNSTAQANLNTESLKVLAVSLAGLLDRFEMHTCNYLKMDCEGGEYEILFSTPPETLGRIERICMEIHDGVTRYSRGEMIAFLERAGYDTRLTLNPVHRELAYLYAQKSNPQKGQP